MSNYNEAREIEKRALAAMVERSFYPEIAVSTPQTASINRISSYAELEHKIQSAVDRRTELKSAITSAQARMQEISKQKKAILVYRRTKDVYTQYRESGWSPAFYREHKADIDAHKEAQAVYSAAGGKLPTLSELSEEYDLLLSQKKQAGEQLSHLNDELKNLRHIKLNMDIRKRSLCDPAPSDGGTGLAANHGLVCPKVGSTGRKIASLHESPTGKGPEKNCSHSQ